MIFKSRPAFLGYASVAGQKESEGPLGGLFDAVTRDGGGTWEQAESQSQKTALELALKKASLENGGLDLIFAGDLLNQCIGSTFGLMDFGRPFAGLYGACSTFAEGLIMAAICVDGGYAEKCAAVASSHFCAAERQYRLPLDYGGQRSPTAQWTVTGAGAAILGHGGGVAVTAAQIGIMRDAGIKDAANMGAAMAPAARDTIRAFLQDNPPPELIVTGDLGAVGKAILADLLGRDGITLPLTDCGELIYDPARQDTHAGGSGCGCSAVTFCAKFLEELRTGKLKSALLCGTGALMSPVSSLQGRSIPAVCHAVLIEGGCL